MRIRMLEMLAGKEVWNVGDIREVSDEIGARLIATGRAELARDDPATMPPAYETAAVRTEPPRRRGRDKHVRKPRDSEPADD